jgi:4a-hydroxytetrahydrobiopterin dehydratase
MVSDLAKEQCVPCQGNEPPMALPEAKKILADLHEGWSINSSGHLERVFLLKNFVESLALANRLGEVAERAGHHPDLLVSYGQLRAEIWTHKISGLARADFVLAAKIDEAVEDFLGAPRV